MKTSLEKIHEIGLEKINEHKPFNIFLWKISLEKIHEKKA